MSETTGRYTLKRPVTVSPSDGKGDSETITQVSLRRPVVGDLRVTDGTPGEVAKAAALIARLSGLRLATVDLIDAEDFQALCELMEGDLPNAIR